MRKSLSVITSNYNHSNYIAQSIEAIISQSRLPDEYIIMDDGSTDNSVEIICGYVEKYPFIRFIRNEQNEGVSIGTKRLIKLSRGDYIYGAAADDFILPGFIEKSMHLLELYPNAGLCCSYPASFNAATGRGSENPLNWSDKPHYFTPEEISQVIEGDYIAGHTSIMKRSALMEAGAFLPELKWHCDWFALLVIAFRHGICFIPEALATIRVLPDSFSASGRSQWLQQKEVLLNLLNILKSPDYRDLIPYFTTGKIMNHFQNEIVRAVLDSPEHWDRETLALIQHPLANWVNETSQKSFLDK